jgi:hypothetical protein
MKKIIRVILILIILILGYFLATYIIDIFNSKKINNDQTLTTIENYNYKLSSSDSKLYAGVFNELKEVLTSASIDGEVYVTLISKLFIIDFYTLANKLNNKDIGGLEFVYSTILDNFKLKAEDTIYKYVESNLYGNRNQDLPIVSSVSVDEVNVVTYTYGNSKDASAYQVRVRITYDKDLGYDTSKILFFIHEESKLSLVEIK